MSVKIISKSINSISKLLRAPNSLVQVAKMSSSPYSYETLNVTIPKEFIYHVELNRPNKRNAMNNTMWLEIGRCFHSLDYEANCRVIILSGAGKIFGAGIDLMDEAQVGTELGEQIDVMRRAKVLKKYITQYQNSITSLEVCKKPVLAAVHSACVGGAVDLITAADMRYCTRDAWFQVKEVDIGMAADVGTLQRLPKVIGNDSLVRELCYTARKFPAEEAAASGLVSKVFQDKESMLQEVLSIAEIIASKSPVAVQGTKANLVFSRDHTVQEGLDHISHWNQMALQSDDFAEAVMAAATNKKGVVFAKL